MRTHDLTSSVILFLVGLFAILYAPQYDLGRLSAPGPGFMPFLTGLAILIFSAITFLHGLLSKPTEAERIWANIEWRKLIFTIVMLMAYALFLNTIGFIICTFFLILILVRYAGSSSWLISVLGGGLSSILCYLLFETWLRSQLPRGIFGF
jgi:putative tricarboxylic transport membrane protein